jgi:predicted GNAT superfamily acetyltransferase
MKKISLHILDTPRQIAAVIELQRKVWTGSDLEVIPTHILLATVHNGGLIIGAYDMGDDPADQADGAATIVHVSGEQTPDDPDRLVGFAFSFPAISKTATGPRLKHHSHMLGVKPGFENLGIGFLLKRAQWQMVRHQDIDRITWTYDPLLSRNAHLNIARLGAVCNTYYPDYYGEMQDDLNIGIASDRFQVDWWLNTKRVARRLSKLPRLKLDLAHFLAAGSRIINPSTLQENGLPTPLEGIIEFDSPIVSESDNKPIVLVEIPSEFTKLKTEDNGLARAWREHTRQLFQRLFGSGYLVTDFIHLPGIFPRSFYVLSHGESTL